MIFSKALLAKGLGGLALLGTSCASAYGGHKIIKNEPTKFDQGLIDHLEQNDGGDIKFDVKDGTTDINNDFPTFSGTTTEKTATIKVKIKTSDSGGTNEGTITEKSGADASETLGSKKYLKKLNGDGEGRDWTWICEIKFTKDSGATDSDQLETTEKEKLVKDSDGFFNKLKGTNSKKLKAHFIKNCAEARGGFENLKIGLSSSLYNNEIKSTKEFKLKKVDSSLKFENQNEFNAWFDFKEN